MAPVTDVRSHIFTCQPWLAADPTPGPWRGEVNHQVLFTRVAAVVHHGGAGSTTAAARAGAPQVVIPQHYDQPYWAQRVHLLGTGTAHPPAAPAAGSLATALSHALRPGVAARAQVIAAAVRTDGARAAALRLIAPDSRKSL